MTQRFRIVWTDTAAKDLLAIIDHIAQRDNVDAATDMHERIRSAVNDLDQLRTRSLTSRTI